MYGAVCSSETLVVFLPDCMASHTKKCIVNPLSIIAIHIVVP